MKKLILCSLIMISVAFGVDCNAMVKRYANKPMMLFKSCTDNNNADACLCSSIVLSVLVDWSRESGDYKATNDLKKAAVIIFKKACQLGNREACAILDEALGQ